jgi:hypothetical protein
MATKDPQVHYDLGHAYAELGLIVDAIAELEAAIALDRTHPRVASAITALQGLRWRSSTPTPPRHDGDA